MTAPHLYFSETCRMFETGKIEKRRLSMFSTTSDFIKGACNAAGIDPPKASPVEMRDAIFHELRLRPCFGDQRKMRLAAAAVKSMVERGQFTSLLESPEEEIKALFKAPAWFPEAFATIVWL